MTVLIHPPPARLLALLDHYASDFEWYCFCLACGHAPARGHDTLQALYQGQARWRGNRMGELYPLVCAHWDVLNLVHQMAAARTDPQRQALQLQLREAKARQRGVVQALRSAWQAG